MAYGRASRGVPWIWTGALGAFGVLLIALIVMRMREEPAPATAGGTTTPVVDLSDAQRYPDPPADGVWETDPLTEETYVQVMAEAACTSRAVQGSPERLRREVDRIYYHYRTDADDLALYAEEVSFDDTRAISVGERIAAATAACR